MRSVLILTILAGAMFPCVLRADVSGSALGRRVISAEELQEAGVSRLTDILELLDEWTPTTIDGFTWQMSPSGLDAYQTQPWIVMVDGMRIDINQFGVTSLNRVPLGVSQIDSVEVLTLPQLHEGEFVEGGLVHVHTCRGGKGYWVGGTAVSGNETGDPGPYRYTDFATPNVDKIGPDFSVEGFYGTGSAYLYADYLKRRHYATDAATRERNLNISGGAYPQMNVTAPSVSFGGRFLGGEHHAFVGYSEFEDFFFFKPFGREIPVVSNHGTGGVRGGFGRGGTIGIDYRVAYTVNEIDYRRNAFDLDFDWRTKALTAELEAIGQTHRTRYRLGVGLDRVEAETSYDLTENDYWLASIYAEGDVRWSRAARQELGISITTGEDDVSLKAMTAGSWQIGPRRKVEAVVAYMERRPEEDGRIWYWRERGYGFLDDAGVGVTADTRLGTIRKWTADASVSSSENHSFSWRASGFYRNHSNLYLEDQPFEFDPAEQAFSGPIQLLSDQSGDVIGCQVTMETRRIPRVRLRTAYRYQKAISGDPTFRNLWDAVARHHFRQRVGYTPVPTFRLWAQLSYYSDSRWHDYRHAEEQSNGGYRPTVDAFIALDAAAEKWFWNRRLRGSLLFKDLLGQSPRYHPIGASLDLSVFIRFELLLGSTGG